MRRRGFTRAVESERSSVYNSAEMFETFSYDIPSVLPAAARDHWTFMESNSAAAVIQAVCPVEWSEIVEVLSTYRLDPNSWLKAGGNRGDIAEQIDALFSEKGWREARLDLETRGVLYSKAGTRVAELPPVNQEGYLVDNFKNRVVLDVEWNAKDGNLEPIRKEVESLESVVIPSSEA